MISKLLLHGESIGGMAAAHAARVCGCELLVCDRTFTSLDALAERIFGWFGPFAKAGLRYMGGWRTSVCADYLAVRGHKVVFQVCIVQR